VQPAILGYPAQKMPGYGFKSMVREVGQKAPAQRQGAVMGIEERLSEAREFVAEKREIKGGVMGEERGTGYETGKPWPHVIGWRGLPEHGAIYAVNFLRCRVNRTVHADQ